MSSLILRRRALLAPNRAPPITGVNWASPQARGLVAWWPGGVGPLRDLSGRGHHQTAQSGVQSDKAGPFGALVKHFNNDGEITTNNIPDLRGASGATITCWVVWQEARANYDGLIGTGAGDNNRFTLSVGGPSVGTTSNTALQVANGSNTYIYASNNVPNQNETYFLAGVYDGTQATASDRANLYTNGLLDSKTVVGTLQATLDSNPTNFVIGSEATNASRDHGGRLWDIRVYDRTLSDREIWEIYAPASRWDLFAGRGLPSFVPTGGHVPAAIMGL